MKSDGRRQYFEHFDVERNRNDKGYIDTELQNLLEKGEGTRSEQAGNPIGRQALSGLSDFSNSDHLS